MKIIVSCSPTQNIINTLDTNPLFILFFLIVTEMHTEWDFTVENSICQCTLVDKLHNGDTVSKLPQINLAFHIGKYSTFG